MNKVLIVWSLVNMAMFGAVIGMEFGHRSAQTEVSYEDLTTNPQATVVTKLKPVSSDADIPRVYAYMPSPHRMCELKEEWR